MSLAVDIIKRGGKRPTEQFDRAKLYASVYSTCLSVRTPEGQARAVANIVCDAVADWLRNRTEVTSHDIRCVAAKALHIHHPEAAYLYKQHRNII